MMTKISYGGYRFPPEIIQQAIWLYVRFTLSFRDVEDLLAECGIVVSYETVRRWVNHFGPGKPNDDVTTPADPHRASHSQFHGFCVMEGPQGHCRRAKDDL